MPLGRFSMDDIAAKLENYTGADIEAVCREAGLIAMRAERKTVSKKHFEEAVERVRPTVTDEMMLYYNRMESLLTSGLQSVRRQPDSLAGIESV
jgi:transitional endoplasmic reticulum ATPase